MAAGFLIVLLAAALVVPSTAAAFRAAPVPVYMRGIVTEQYVYGALAGGWAAVDRVSGDIVQAPVEHRPDGGMPGIDAEGSMMAWTDQECVWAYDVESSVKTTVTVAGVNDNITAARVSGSRVAWVGGLLQLPLHWPLHVADLATGQTWDVDEGVEACDIDGDWVALYRGSGTDLPRYPGAGFRIQNIISGEYHDVPAIAEVQLTQSVRAEIVLRDGVLLWQTATPVSPEEGVAALCMYDMATGASRVVALGEHWGYDVSGDCVVYDEAGDIWTYSISTGGRQEVLAEPEREEWPSIFGRDVLFAVDMGQLYLGDLDDPGTWKGPWGPQSPFSLGVDAYSFPNYRGSEDATLFREVFGLTSVEAQQEMAQLYYNSYFKPSYGIGQCYGMAATAAMFHAGVFGPKPTDIPGQPPGVTATRQLVRQTTGGGARDLDEPLERHIAKYFYFQCDPDFAVWEPPLRTPFSPVTFGAAYDLVSAAITEGWTDPYLLDFWWFGGGSYYGHAVNITGCDYRDVYLDRWPWQGFVTYDNNFPSSLKSFEASQGGMVALPYPAALGGSVRRVSAHYKDHIQPPWGSSSPSGLSAALYGSMTLLHTDETGRRVGHAGDATYAELPGAREIIWSGGLGESRPQSFYLPKSGDYRIDIRTTDTGPEGYELFLGGDAYSVASPVAPKDSGSVLVSKRDAHGFAYSTSGGEKSVALDLYRELSAGNERAFKVSGTKMAADEEIALSSPGDAKALVVALKGPARSYDLDVVDRVQGSRRTMALADIPIPADAIQTIEVWDWSDPAASPVFVTTRLPGGQESVTAHRVAGMSLPELLQQMRDAGLIPNDGVSRSILAKGKAPLKSLRMHLDSLVAEGSITMSTANLIHAYMVASRQ